MSRVYNRYIPNGASYTRIAEEDDFPSAPRDAPAAASEAPGAPLAEAPGGEPEKKGGLAGLLKSLKLDELDTGDILLLLIMLFLFLEGDDMELVITLGLILLLSL